MHRYTPKPNRLPAVILSAVCFLAAFSLFVPYSADETFLVFIKGVSTGIFLIGFVILDRYAFTSFSYSIEANDSIPGRLDFVVSSVRYGRIRTVCRVSAFDVTDIVKYDKNRKAEKGVKKYNYCPDLAGENRYILFLDDDGDAEILFCPDEKTVNIIKNIINSK